ncbi:hypothetical protein HGA64_01280 [Candidatus Falkowbacteria bacterium]|nr:hypothetical protein [Candidatus Falkowbacteria bacterium]
MDKKRICVFISAILSIASPALALAAAPSTANTLFGRMNAVTTNAGYEGVTETSVLYLVGQLINVFFGLLGTIFIVLIVYSGYNWMTAAGENGKVETAKKTLWQAVIGLIITVGAYAIWAWVVPIFAS